MYIYIHQLIIAGNTVFIITCISRTILYCQETYVSANNEVNKKSNGAKHNFPFLNHLFLTTGCIGIKHVLLLTNLINTKSCFVHIQTTVL